MSDAGTCTTHRTIIEDAYFHFDNGGLHSGLLEQSNTYPDGSVEKSLSLLLGQSSHGVLSDYSIRILNVAHATWLIGIINKAKALMEGDDYANNPMQGVGVKIGVTAGLRVEEQWSPVSGSDREVLIGHAFYDQVTGAQERFQAWEGVYVDRPSPYGAAPAETPEPKSEPYKGSHFTDNDPMSM